MKTGRFTIRVYGILEWNDQILLVNERIGDFEFTKFPGGGLEWGEGIKECLVREFKEETGLEVMIGSHLYTTDFFQQSAFRDTDQLIAVYYQVTPITDPAQISLDAVTININGVSEYLQFFWIGKSAFRSDLLTFPVDKHVAGLIQTIAG